MEFFWWDEQQAYNTIIGSSGTSRDEEFVYNDFYRRQK